MCSPEATAWAKERRRWRPHRVQGSDGQISEEGQPMVLGSRPEFKEPAVRRSGPRESKCGGAAGGW
jgi:hypothetical protein